MGTVKKGNIAIFVPHNGCPHRCSFCDQRSITGVKYQPTASDVDKAVETALSAKKQYDLEIAFFGGSFTAIDRDYMISLLKAAKRHIESGAVKGIRLSTRPDAIDGETLDILEYYGVTAIELGAQSLCEEVLKANLRGHTAGDVEAASRLIKERGFSLGLQMMTGLYKSTPERDIYTAEKIIELCPDTVRIYPTVTLKGTLLGELYLSGEYVPMTLEQSVELCAILLEKFRQHSIEVIRLGLHYSEELVGGMLYNNYHPAFRELCEGRIMLDKFNKQLSLSGLEGEKNITAYVHLSCVSKLSGHRRVNTEALKAQGITLRIKPDNNAEPFDIRLEALNAE